MTAKEYLLQDENIFISVEHGYDIRLEEDEVLIKMEGFAELKAKESFEAGVSSGQIYENRTQMVSSWAIVDYPTYEQWKEEERRP